MVILAYYLHVSFINYSRILPVPVEFSSYLGYVTVFHCVIHWSFDLYEPPRGKTNNVVSEQVRHKPTCTSTEKS